MKRYLLILIAVFMLIPGINIAQQKQQDDRIVVSASDLPPSVLEEIKKKQQLKDTEFQIEKYGKWAGMGEEIGEAVAGSLNAVKDVSIEFADSDLGHFTMAMVAWKVMGSEIVGFLIVIPIILLAWTFILRSYFKTCVPRKVYTEGRQPFLMRPFKSSGPYKMESPMWNEGGAAALHFIAMVAVAAILITIVL